MATQKHLLFCPGPVNTTAAVKRAIASYDIGHRENEFEVLFHSVQSQLLKLFKVKNTSHYTPVIISGSGTAANETTLSSIVGKRTILVISNGEFGERLYAISKLHNKATKHIGFAWGLPIDLKAVEAKLKAEKIDIIAVVHHETSTGMLNDITAIGKMAKKYGAAYMVDTVSSAGAEIIDIEKSNISFLTCSTGKALCAYPGLSFVIGKNTEFEMIKNHKPKTMYLDLYKFYFYATTKHQTPNTPAIQLIFALDQALKELLKEGIEKRNSILNSRAVYLRAKMKKMGLTFAINADQMSCVLTSVVLPNDLVASELKKKMKEENIVVYDGKGPLEHITFQVANIGQITRADMNHFLRVLRAVLAAGTGAAQSVPAHRIQPLESVNTYDIQTARS